MIKAFVFDTNALISAYILGGSKNRKAYGKAFDSGILVYSGETFDEFAKTIVRSKFEKYLVFEHRLDAIKEYRAKGFLVNVHLSITDCRDPKDNKFLELAVAAKASCIITGDDDLLILHPLSAGQAGFRGIPILNANDFLNMTF